MINLLSAPIKHVLAKTITLPFSQYYPGSEDGEPVAEGKKRQDAEVCSSPTAGATSESIGDSVMDSIHKTPDALLPQDDTSELHEIEEVRIKEHGKLECVCGGNCKLVHKKFSGLLFWNGVTYKILSYHFSYYYCCCYR